MASRSTKRKKVMKLDKKDEAIMHCIEQNPTILLKLIPLALERAGNEPIPYATVQRHVSKLMENGFLTRSFTINWAKAGYLVRYRVGILIDPVELREKATDKPYRTQKELADYILRQLANRETFKNNLLIDDVYILLSGHADLSIDFFAKDDKTATQFIIDALRGLSGVSNTGSAKLTYSARLELTSGDGWLSKNGEQLSG
jgi:DNA-binding Lrp family transcriptional regulator